MFVDDDADGYFHSGEALLFERDAPAASVNIGGKGSVSSMVAYDASGQSLTATGAFQRRHHYPLR
ncbi:MAG: hypothetical protein ACI89D_001743 [Bermanella sp.]|jgi:hypothetical protein